MGTSPVRVRDPFRSRDDRGVGPRGSRVSPAHFEYRPVNTLRGAARVPFLASHRTTASLDDVFSRDRQQSLDRRCLFGKADETRPLRLERSGQGDGKAGKGEERVPIASPRREGGREHPTPISKYLTRTLSSEVTVLMQDDRPQKRTCRESFGDKAVHAVADGGNPASTEGNRVDGLERSQDSPTETRRWSLSADRLPCVGLEDPTLLRLSMMQVGSRVLAVTYPTATLVASVDASGSALQFTFNNKASYEARVVALSRRSIVRMRAYFSARHSYVDLELTETPQALAALWEGSPVLDCRVVRLTAREGTTKLCIHMVFDRLHTSQVLTESATLQEYRPDWSGDKADPDHSSAAVLQTLPPLRRHYTRQSGPAGGYQRGSRQGEEVETICRPAVPRTEAKPRVLFTYPPGAAAHISITSNELLHLPEGVYFNDTLIDFDLQYMLDRVPRRLSDRMHVFSSFFYRKLASQESPRTAKSSITKVDVFGKRFIFVPINESVHWYLAVIFNPLEGGAEAASSVLEGEGEGGQRPCIIIFDSLGSRHRRSAMDRLKLFLVNEARTKRGIEMDKRDIQAIYARVPTQLNSTDCGCFLLEYVERLLEAPEEMVAKILLKEDLSQLFSPDDAALRRLKLRQRLEELEADYEAMSGEGETEVTKVFTASSDIEEISPPLEWMTQS